jgi:hypothetical protein
MLGRRVLALLVAVLCIVARIGAEADGSRADEVEALAGPGLLCRTSPEVNAEPVGSTPDGLVDSPRPPDTFACIAPRGPVWAPRAVGPAGDRRGDPKASRGPPSLVVS